MLRSCYGPCELLCGFGDLVCPGGVRLELPEGAADDDDGVEPLAETLVETLGRGDECAEGDAPSPGRGVTGDPPAWALREPG